MSTEGYFDPGHEPDDPQIGDVARPLHHSDMPTGPWAAGEQSWEKVMVESDRWLREHVDVEHGIDEVALLFFDYEHVFNFITQAVAQKEVRLFGADTDHVQVDPLRSFYHVSYWWLEHADKTYRLELMMKSGGGCSPVHDDLRMQAIMKAEKQAMEEGLEEVTLKAPVVVHMSFKARDAVHYERINQELNHSDDAEYIQFCRSAYGMFSYWRIPSLWETVASTYIKPRVNMRSVSEWRPS